MMSIHRNQATYESADIVDYYVDRDGLLPCETYIFDHFIGQVEGILELGVGGGRVVPFLASKAKHYVGIDYSQPMVDACRKKFPRLELYCEDASDLHRFGDETFDVVVFSFNGIDHIPTNLARACCLKEIRRVLRPESIFIFSSHNARMTNLWPVANTEPGLASQGDNNSRLSDKRKTIYQRLKLPAIGKRLLHASRALLRTSFYTGKGYAMDPVHGGLWTFQATPKRWKRELSQEGFDVKAVVSPLFPRESSIFLTPWFYYVTSAARITSK